MKKVANAVLDLAEILLVFAVCNYLLWQWLVTRK